jgi:hypothetical protein
MSIGTARSATANFATSSAFATTGESCRSNRINAHAIAKLYGPEGDAWAGCWVTLYYDGEVKNPTTGEMGGVRIRDRIPGAETATAKPPAPDVPPRGDPDDEIPF